MIESIRFEGDASTGHKLSLPVGWRIDPHTHSNISDGTDTPADLVRMAQREGLDMVGLTDHDTTAGWEEATETALEIGQPLLRGTEVSCTHRGITVHMLGYLFDPRDSDLQQMFTRIRTSRTKRAWMMVERLAEDFPITYADVAAQAPEGGPVGRPHIADALVAAGVFSNRSEAFAQVLHPRHRYYVKLWSPSPLDVVRAVRRAGGVPVFAHPRAVSRQRFFVDYRAICELQRQGLFGIEVDHRDHSSEWRVQVGAIAARTGLEVFGSSDYHGTGKPNRLGENTTAPEVVSRLLEQASLGLIGGHW